MRGIILILIFLTTACSRVSTNDNENTKSKIDSITISMESYIKNKLGDSSSYQFKSKRIDTVGKLIDDPEIMRLMGIQVELGNKINSNNISIYLDSLIALEKQLELAVKKMDKSNPTLFRVFWEYRAKNEYNALVIMKDSVIMSPQYEIYQFDEYEKYAAERNYFGLQEYYEAHFEH